MTAPDLYRGIAGDPGVICIDEQEKWIGERAEALKAILRSGYGEGMEVTRQRQREDGRWERDSFPVYCPKALASINPLDDTTQSRTIVVHMRPALRGIPEFDATRVERWAGLRDDLHLWGLANAADIHKPTSTGPHPTWVTVSRRHQTLTIAHGKSPHHSSWSRTTSVARHSASR